jgi:hypothetical protein
MSHIKSFAVSNEFGGPKTRIPASELFIKFTSLPIVGKMRRVTI